jgi:hypothetical protein
MNCAVRTLIPVKALVVYGETKKERKIVYFLNTAFKHACIIGADRLNMTLDTNTTILRGALRDL